LGDRLRCLLQSHASAGALVRFRHGMAMRLGSVAGFSECTVHRYLESHHADEDNVPCCAPRGSFDSRGKPGACRAADREELGLSVLALDAATTRRDHQILRLIRLPQRALDADPPKAVSRAQARHRLGAGPGGGSFRKTGFAQPIADVVAIFFATIRQPGCIGGDRQAGVQAQRVGDMRARCCVIPSLC
jgi:hypothetical protein